VLYVPFLDTATEMLLLLLKCTEQHHLRREQILSFYFNWPQQIHRIVENNSKEELFTLSNASHTNRNISPGCSRLRAPTTTFATNLPSASLVSSMQTHVLFFSDTISYFVDCILIERNNIVLSERGFGGNGISCVFFQELSKPGGLYFM
jgi:hypothetical protein